jgi:MFS family permease
MGRARTTLIVAVAAQAAVSIVQFGMPAIEPQIRSHLQIGPAGFGAVFAAIGLGAALVLIPVGILVDRFGARPVLFGGALLNALGYLAAASTSNAWAFAGGVFLAGVGSAAVPVAGMSSLIRAFPPEKRGIVLGWRQLAVPMGGTIGSIMLPLLAHRGGVQLALLCAGAATTITSAWFAVLSRGEGGTAGRLTMDGVLTAPGMRPLLCVALLYAFPLSAALTYLVPAARSAGLTAAIAGIAFTVLNLSAAASRLVWGRMADRHGGTQRTRVLATSGTLTTIAALLAPAAMSLGPATALVVVLGLGFGAFGFNGVLYVTAGELVGADRAARAVGVASTVVFGATSLAAPLAGLVAEHVGYGAMWLVAAVSAAGGVAVAARVLPRARRAGQLAAAQA